MGRVAGRVVARGSPEERKLVMRPSSALLLLLLAGLSTGGFEIKESEYKCESALAHLKDCCPSFEPSNYSCYSEACTDVQPDLTIADSDCLRAKTCRELNDEGYCSRPRLGVPSVNVYDCQQALYLIETCCGVGHGTAYACETASVCGVATDDKPLLPANVIECARPTLFGTQTCEEAKKNGLCGDLGSVQCAK